MPIINSAIKRARQNPVRQARRKPVTTYMRTMIRKMEDTVKAGKKADAEKLLPEVYKAIDMAVKRYIIHRNNGARKKSSMAKLVAGVK